MDVLWEWVNINYQWLVSTLLSVIIAYHVYYLSKRVTLKDKLEHKEIIKSKTDNLISKIVREGLRRKVLLVNINRYFKDYPSNTEKIGGYSVIAGEIKATRYDGVEFFCDMPKSIYEREDGKITFNSKKNFKKCGVVFPVGIVPYSWIDHIDPEGDEFDYRPLFYIHFKGKVYWNWWRRLIPFGYPYSKLVYYRRSESFQEGIDPHDMEYIQMHDEILK